MLIACPTNTNIFQSWFAFGTFFLKQCNILVQKVKIMKSNDLLSNSQRFGEKTHWSVSFYLNKFIFQCNSSRIDALCPRTAHLLSSNYSTPQIWDLYTSRQNFICYFSICMQTLKSKLIYFPKNKFSLTSLKFLLWKIL